MKKFIIISILAALFAAGTTLMAQDKQEDYLGLPGDNLNLYAVMKLFQQSKTLEEFERILNDEKSNINNLDLNGDNMVDYIKVFDDVDGDVHNIVLQVAVSPKENQDVAVFTVQRFNNGQVQIQLTGDEELYGKNYIIEPIFDNENNGETPNPGYTGNTQSVNGQNITYIRTTPAEIAGWPLVRFMYLPSYTTWQSSWYWGYYPTYWHPWRPAYYHYYYGYHYNWNNDYFGHYRRWDSHRYTRWNDFYYSGRRSFSPDVNRRIEVGTYKATYSHPDQRKDGENKFAKMHPDEYRRSSDNSSGNNSVRRSDPQSKNVGQSNGKRASTTRRSTTTMTNRSATDPSVGKNTGTTRRSSGAVTNKSVVNRPPEKPNVTTRRSSTTVTNKSVVNRPPEKPNVTTRRSSTTVTDKSVINRAPKKNNVTNRRTVKKNKSETKIKKDNNPKETENKDATRRK